MIFNQDNYRKIVDGVKEGQDDGLFLETATDRLCVVKNSVVDSYLQGINSCRVFEDFIGKALNVTDSVWGTHSTSATNTNTLAIKADYDNGAFEMLLEATSENKVAGLYWNDEQNIDSDQKPVMTCRLQIPTAITTAEILAFGLTSARNSTFDSVANHASFRLDASMALKLESDDATTDNDDKAPDTAVTLSAATWYEFKIDATDPLDVRFYYRATLGGEWTALTKAGITFKVGADIALQPNFQLQKASGTTTPSILIDYVEVVWTRN